MSDKMKFAKYYNATNMMKKLIKEEKLFTYKDAGIKGLYVCLDTHDMWICRIIEGFNSEYEEVQDKWLVERNKIDKYSLIDFIETKENKKYDVRNRYDREDVLDSLDINNLIKYVIEYDDEEGMENWDNYECDSLEECVEVIDGGFGIIEL